MPEIKLTEEQVEVATRVESASPGEMIVLRGYAGTGKTYLSSRIINSGNFHNPIVATPTAAALNALRRKFAGNVPEGTVFNTFAYLTSRPVPLLRVGKYPKSYAVRLDDFNATGKYEVGIQEFLKNRSGGKNLGKYIDERQDDSGNTYYDVDTEGMSKALGIPVAEDVRFDTLPLADIANRLSDYDLMVIDEYSMIDQNKHELVTDLVAEFGATGEGPVVMVCGDAGQLQPVKGLVNEAIRLDPDDYSVFELTKPMRSGDEIAEFAARLRKGTVDLGNVAASPNPLVLSAENTVVATFNKHKDVFAETDMALTWKNANVKQLNALMRAQRGHSGTVKVGEPLIVTRNVYGGPGEIEWANGEIMHVAEIADPAAVASTIKTNGPRVVEAWRKKIQEHEDEIATLSGRETDNPDDEDRIETLTRDAARLTGRIEDMEEGIDQAVLMVQNGLVGLVTLTDGFGTKTSERRAFVALDPVDGNDRVWRSQKQTLRRVGWLFNKRGSNESGVKPVDTAFAYALTVHKAQGSEANSVVYVAASGEIWAQAKDAYDGQDWHAPYTAITRAREKVRVLYTGARRMD